MHKSMLITDETKLIAFGPITIYKIYGRNNTGATVFIQFHENLTVAAGDVPATKALEATANTWFDWSFEKGLSLTQLLLAMSSTQVNYTALVNAGLDCTIEYETNFENTLVIPNIVGDLTTAVASRQIWTPAVGKKQLRRLSIINNSGDAVSAWISARELADITVSNSTHRGPFACPDSATPVELLFGVGVSPFEKVAGVYHEACAVFFTASPVIGGAKLTAADYNVRALYD